MRGSFDTPMSVAGVGGWVPSNRARMRHNLEDGCLASSDGFGAGGHPGVNLSQPGRSFPEPQSLSCPSILILQSTRAQFINTV